MIRRSALIFALLLVPAILPADDWPRFRGPGARGVADGADLPSRWDVSTGENVRWKVSVPGLGHSSPIVQSGRIFLTTAVAEKTGPELRLGDEGGIDLVGEEGTLTWKMLAFDLSGAPRWEREVGRGIPAAQRHVKASQANATPAADATVVVAILASGLYAFDLDGDPLWQVDLGRLDPGLFGDESSQWGHASSPVVHDGRVFVQVDRHAGSFVAAYEAGTGRELWKVSRDERPGWSTPTVHLGPQGAELIVLGSAHARGYDPATGSELWVFADESEVRIPAPFVVDGRIVLSGGYRGRPLHALSFGMRGDLTGKAQWSSEPGGPYTSTPVAYGEWIFSVANEGILSVWRLATGERVHRARVEEHFSASPLASDGRIFLPGEGGEVLVFNAAETPKELARNDMGEACMATPAISSDTMYVRTLSQLWAISQVR